MEEPKLDENGRKRNPDGTFAEGDIGGPGRPPDTPEKKIEKKVIKELVEEYKQALAESLPEIRPVLKAKALEGDVPAIKEIHDRVMGKALQSVDHTTMGEKIVFNTISYADNNPVSLPTKVISTSTTESIRQRQEESSDSVASPLG